jgi:hypothetical protein
MAEVRMMGVGARLEEGGVVAEAAQILGRKGNLSSRKV